MNLKKLKCRVFLPDKHTPNHSVLCHVLVLKVLETLAPVDELVFLGDQQDCATVSFHDKPAEVALLGLEQELAPGIDLMHDTVRAAKAKKVVFLAGNHEWRIVRYAHSRAPHLAQLVNLRKILGVPRTWRFFPYGQEGHYKVTKNLVATHGSWHNKHAAAKALEMFGCSVIHGHTHRIQHYSKRDVYGRQLDGYSAGWLGDPRLAGDYMKGVPDWGHGFIVGWFHPDGRYWLEQLRIEKGILVHGGKIYTAR